MFLGPYSYRMAPVEHFFAKVKSADIARGIGYQSVNVFPKGSLDTHPECRLMRHMASAISQLDLTWIGKSFNRTLTQCLEFMSLRPV
jgi:hypothetical protein